MSDERKRPGPKPKYHGGRVDVHVMLSAEVVRALDQAAASEGRPAFIERVLREKLNVPESEGKHD